MATETISKINPKIHFQPNWKKEEHCFQEEKVEYTHRNGKEGIRAMATLSYPQMVFDNRSG